MHVPPLLILQHYHGPSWIQFLQPTVCCALVSTCQYHHCCGIAVSLIISRCTTAAAVPITATAAAFHLENNNPITVIIPLNCGITTLSISMQLSVVGPYKLGALHMWSE